MTTFIPESWELPSYLAGDFHDLSDYRRQHVPEQRQDDANVLPFQKKLPDAPAPAWSQNSLAEVEPYDPEKHGRGPAELYDQNHIDALHKAGFEPHEQGVWHRPNADGVHIISYSPGHREDGRLKPWNLSTDADEVGTHLSTLHGALSLADAHAMPLREASVFLDWTKIGAGRSPGRQNADDWLAQNTPESFEADPRTEAERWMEEHAHEYDEWHPSTSDYTYSDFPDFAGGTFPENSPAPVPASSWPDQDREHYQQPTIHEQDLADLGFNWQHRGDPNTTPVGIYQEGEYVRHQHDPEGKHIATHRMYRDPNGRSDQAWHLEHESADTPGFSESHTTHRFPHDAISYYHHNAERALLPQRGYEHHRGPSGVVTHWTRVDTDPKSGAKYHHEISNQPPSGEGNHQGWLGQTFGDHMNRSYAPNGARNQSVQPDLAAVVREHDRIGRGLHPGGSQDYRTTRDELLGDPSVARLGTPSGVSDGFYGDNKVGSARWHWPHPDGNHLPHVNAEATYNWDKGGYDFKYTHDGTWLAASHNAVPAGAPFHVPGRQTQLPIAIDHPFNIDDYRRPRGE